MYEAYGKALVSVQEIENNFRFPGQYYDDETGLHYNFFRYYDTETGRYISVDPARSGLNFYAYCGANPLGSVDPYGLCAVRSAVGGLGNFIYSGGLAGYGLRSLAGALDNMNPTSYWGAYANGFASSITNSLASMSSAESYVNGAMSFGGTVNSLYQQDGVMVAASYATTSWNVGAIYEGAANQDLATGQPIGDGFERTNRIISGSAATAGIAIGGVGLGRNLGYLPKPRTESPVSGLPRTGSALKYDPQHSFPDIVDNFAGDCFRRCR